MRVQSASLKNHIFSVFFIQATRYSLVILLIDTSSLSSSSSSFFFCCSSFDPLHLDARGARTKVPSTISPSFPLFSLLENRRYHRALFPLSSEILIPRIPSSPLRSERKKYAQCPLTKSHTIFDKMCRPLPSSNPLSSSLLFFAS